MIRINLTTKQVSIEWLQATFTLNCDDDAEDKNLKLGFGFDTKEKYLMVPLNKFQSSEMLKDKTKQSLQF